MIVLLTAYTLEADDPAKAVKEILEGLNLPEKQRTYSAALVFCHVGFIESGVMGAVCKSLPCDTVGCTSMYFALPGGVSNQIMLTVAMLTSDDIRFAAGLSVPLNAGSINYGVQDLYQKTAAAFNEKPSLAFVAEPVILNGVCSDMITAALDSVSGGMPLFGLCALDIDIKLRSPKTIFRGEAYSDRMALLLCKGPVKPRFFSRFFPEKSIIVQDAVITGAAGNQITTINNKPAVFFMQDLGLVSPDRQFGTVVFPLVINYQDGSEPQIAVVDEISSTGALVCTRSIRSGGILNIGSVSADYVLESAKNMFEELRKSKDGSGMLILSCFLRNIALGGNLTGEIELLQQELAQSPWPWLFLYSGSEICPQPAKNGGLVNRHCQYALIACQF